MLNFNSKILTLLAIGFLIYFGYLQKKQNEPLNPNMRRDFEESMGLDRSKNATYKIEVPKNKKYENYNLLEKFIYDFSQHKKKEW